MADWQSAYAAWDQNNLTLTGLSPSTTYEFQIRAVDYASPVNYGAWSGTTSFLTATDTTAPATPAAPSVSASLIAVQVTHTLGLASGGTYNLPLDMDHFRVHVGTSSGFTPSAANLVGKLLANGGMVSGGIPAVGYYPVDTLVAAGAVAWVKVVAVDKTGNMSAASAAASATALLIDDAHFGTLTVAKLTSGTITAASILAGSFKTATSGKRVEFDANGLRQYNASGVLQIHLDNTTGNATFSGALSAASGTFAGALSAATGTFAGDLSAAGGTFAGALSAASGTFSGTITGSTITGGTVQTASSGARVVLSSGAANRIDLYSSSGDHGYVRANASGTNSIGVYSNNGTEYLLAVNGTCSINSADGVVSANTSGFYLTSAPGGGSAVIQGANDTISINAVSAINIGTASGYTTAINLGLAGGSLGLTPSDIGLSNIPGSSGTSIALKMVSRKLEYVSSARASKVDIADAEITPESALLLRPVSFYDKAEVARAGGTDGLPRHFGFVAEEVAEIPGAGSLVIYDADGSVMSLGYDRVPAVQQVILRDLAARVAALEAKDS